MTIRSKQWYTKTSRLPVESKFQICLARLLSSGVLVGHGSVGEGNLGSGPSPASLGSTAGAWPIRPANTPANHRTKSPVPPACEGEEISFPWCTIGHSLGTERQVRSAGNRWAGKI